MGEKKWHILKGEILANYKARLPLLFNYLCNKPAKYNLPIK